MRKVLEGESSLDQELATQLLKRLMEDPKPEPNGCPTKSHYRDCSQHARVRCLGW